MLRTICAAFMLIVIGACGKGVSGGDCTSNDDCDGRQLCSPSGACVDPCNGDTDCDKAFSCVLGLCERVHDECETDAMCVAAGAPCEGSIEAVCRGGLCQCTTCLENGDCEDDNACTTEQCEEGVCVYDRETLKNSTCELESGGQGKCLADGSSLSCQVGLGFTCLSDVECGDGSCECIDATCSARVCATADCDCRYGDAGACVTLLPSGTADKGDCEGLDACYDGTCKRALGAECTSDDECGTGFCECADDKCRAQVCANEACDCGYVSAGGTCAGDLDEDTQQPNACDGANACYAGACSLRLGELCDDNADCGSGVCQCADIDCSEQVCTDALVVCDCGYVDGELCLGFLNPGVQDPETCDGASGCFQGVCLKRLGQACDTNTECGSKQCECANANCTSRVCATSNCVCRYGAGGSCPDGSFVDDGPYDPLDCPNNCVSGACLAALGDPCTLDAQCQSGSCECTDAACTVGECSTNSCLCGYGDNGGCGTALTTGVKDIGDCEGNNACYGVNNCKKALGTTCTADSECGLSHCECVDASCSSRKCAASNCVCGFDSNGGCGQDLTNGTNDPQDCVDDGDGDVCAGGECKKKDGQACTVDDTCASGICFSGSCLANPCTGTALSATPFAGAGTVGDPYLICTPAQWAAIGTVASTYRASGKVFRIGQNIDLTSYDGLDGHPSLAPVMAFGASIKGYDRVISNLRIRSADPYVAPFTSLAPSGSIADLRFAGLDVGASASTGSYLGGVVGSGAGALTRVRAQGTLAPYEFSGGYCGGLVSRVADNMTIAASSWSGSFGATTGCQNAGGLVAYAGDTTIIRDSFATGTLAGDRTGGLVGFVGSSGALTIERSYASASVLGGSNAGGLVGDKLSTGNAAASASFSVGTVASSYAGGITGDSGVNLTSCYWFDASGADNATTCEYNVADSAGVCVKESTLGNFYVASGAGAHPVYGQTLSVGDSKRWDFSTVWKENAGALPSLR